MRNNPNKSQNNHTQSHNQNHRNQAKTENNRTQLKNIQKQSNTFNKAFKNNYKRPDTFSKKASETTDNIQTQSESHGQPQKIKCTQTQSKAIACNQKPINTLSNTKQKTKSMPKQANTINERK